MQAFKFRSLVNLDRVLSMIRSGDLWCAPWSELNDPMEGFYFYHAGDNVSEEQRIVANIKSAKLGRYVCSLSARWDIAGLWAYYADDFRGVTLEYDLTNLSSSPNLKSGKVRYRPVSEAFDIMRDQDPQHEDEIRILSRRSGRLRIPQGIRSVTLGNRMDVDVQEVIANYCRLRNIMVNVLKISADGFERLPFDFTATANRRRQR
jgi:hypothetical protein